jgi:hypothetical protein
MSFGFAVCCLSLLLILACTGMVWGQAGTGVLWDRYWAGAGRNMDSIAASVLDAAGNVYVTGTGFRTNESLDVVTTKYNTNGDTIWRSYYSGARHADDGPVGMTIDNYGNIFVAATTMENVALRSSYLTLIKYNGGTGARLWAKSLHFNTSTFDADEGAAGLAYDSVLGRIYTCATLLRSDSVLLNSYVVRYDTGTGDTVWTRRYDGGRIDSDSLLTHQAYAAGITVAGNSPNRDPVMTGYYYNTSDLYNWFVERCSTANGKIGWVRKIYWDVGNGDEEPVGITSDANGNIWVTGYRYRNNTSVDWIATAKIRGDNSRIDTTAVNHGDDDN